MGGQGAPPSSVPGLLLAQAASRRPRAAAPLIPRQVAPEYLDRPLDPSSKSTYIGVRLAKNCRGWVAKIKVGMARMHAGLLKWWSCSAPCSTSLSAAWLSGCLAAAVSMAGKCVKAKSGRTSNWPAGHLLPSILCSLPLPIALGALGVA
jgi:hypothetical protein